MRGVYSDYYMYNMHEHINLSLFSACACTLTIGYIDASAAKTSMILDNRVISAIELR